MPEISVVIPFYNDEKYLYDCINSVVNQTFKDIEIICIDDGSVDSSKNIVFSFQDERIKYYYQEHQGVSSARNKGIENIHGKYLLFLDADDWLEFNACEKLIKIVNSNKSTDVLFFNYRYFHEKESKVFDFSNNSLCNKFKESPISFEKISNAVLLLNYVIWNKFYRVDFLKKHSIKFNEKYKLSEDMLFSIELFSFNPTVMMFPDVLYNYRLRDNSSSRLSYEEMFCTLFEMYDYVIVQHYYKFGFKLFVDNIFLKMCLYIFNTFNCTEKDSNIFVSVDEVIKKVRKQKNVNILNSFRYRKLYFIVVYNNFLKSLTHKLCIF